MASKRQKRWFLVIVATFTLTACPPRHAIWIEPGSTIDALTFRVSDERGGTQPIRVAGLRVDRCGDDPSSQSAPMWGAGGGPGTSDMVFTHLEYGVMPSGYVPLMDQGDTALTLVPGCYTATIGAGSNVVFDVREDGRVVERVRDS